MSTSIVPPPDRPSVTLTAEQFDELMAKKSPKAAPQWWTAFTAKVAATGGWKHAIWITWLGVGTVVAADPAAHQAFLTLWAHVPKWAVDGVAIAAPIAAYFIKPTQ
jgi:2-methylisocitrate lyase-like PEP mutase family enzyme